MRLEITLTDAERVALCEALMLSPLYGVESHSEDYAEGLARFVTAALSAVPRLALAAPVVGELVERAYAEGHIDSFFGPRGADRDAAIARDWAKSKAKAALTGEEGRDVSGS